MSSTRTTKKSSTRRAFFQDVTAGAAGIAVASALAELNAPAMAIPQLSKMPPAPPWPKGSTGNKYDHLFCSKFKEKSITDAVASPQAYFRGASELPGAGINMGWQLFVKPIRLEVDFHTHDVDEYLIFLGATLPDLIGSFDGEIELFLGEELERHVITKATVLYIPRGMQHCPLDIKRLTKPMMFSALMLAPNFNGVYGKDRRYMSFNGMGTID
jgi:hypothetical protein